MNTIMLAQEGFPPNYKNGLPAEPDYPDPIADGSGLLILAVLGCVAFAVLAIFLCNQRRKRMTRVHRERQFPRYPVLPKPRLRRRRHHRHHRNGEARSASDQAPRASVSDEQGIEK